MTDVTSKVVPLRKPGGQAALESLNRITGLSFSRWPESLANSVPRLDADSPSARRQLLA